MGMKKGTTYVQTTDEQIKEAFEKYYGVIKTSAEYLGISRQALQIKLRNNPELRKYQMECVKAGNDLARGKLLEAVERGEAWGIQFWLRHMDSDFCDVQNMNFSGTLNTTNTNVDLKNLNMEELEKLHEIISRATTNEDSDSDGDLQTESV